ncbi:MAG: bpiD [Candidatus Sulfotelmatobacter sp.]|nr:bpiD [Candidatus Sulfotelmatobacter sp.]
MPWKLTLETEFYKLCFPRNPKSDCQADESRNDLASPNHGNGPECLAQHRFGGDQLATNPNPSPTASLPVLKQTTDRGSRAVVLGADSNELVFAVVGHAGSGTTLVAQALAAVLKETSFNSSAFDVVTLKARDVIKAWAEKHGKTVPPDRPGGERLIEDVKKYQDLGDEMRKQVTASGEEDHPAVARALVLRIREARAQTLKLAAGPGQPVPPDGKPRAYILDSLRHPAEVNLLRAIYGDAFVLIGVVCEEEKRVNRMSHKYSDAGHATVRKFMERDAAARESHGQQVAKAFHLSDFFVDNTIDRTVTEDVTGNEDWDFAEHLSRLITILTHTKLIRPEIGETAMHHANSAKMRSACLSRQVGAALVDSEGNIVATGTNEVPKAGGGVYGESFGDEEHEGRCGLLLPESQRFCRNTRQQNEIIADLIESVPELKNADAVRKTQLEKELRHTRIGSLIEFSRAVHAEMDAILSAARQGGRLTGTRLFVTTFPCHYCARHIVSAGVDEVQYIEPYPKSQALDLHADAIQVEATNWKPPSENGSKVLFRPFSGVSPRFYKKAFLKERDLKDNASGDMKIGAPEWGQPWSLRKNSYIELEAELSKVGEETWKPKPPAPSN